MYFENYLKTRNEPFNAHHNAPHPGLHYQLNQQSSNNRPISNTQLNYNHYNLNIQTMDQPDPFRHAPNHYNLQHDFRKFQITPPSPINSHNTIPNNKFQHQNASNHYIHCKPPIHEEKRFVNPSPNKVNNRSSTSINRQQFFVNRYERRSQSISAAQPRFGEHYKLNATSNVTISPTNNQKHQEHSILYKNGVSSNQNIKFNLNNTSIQTQAPQVSYNPGYYGYIGRKSSNLSNDSENQTIRLNQQQCSQTTPNKQPTNHASKYMKNIQNFTMEKFPTNYLDNNSDRKYQYPLNIDKNNQIPINTFYQYKKKQVQKLNSTRIPTQVCVNDLNSQKTNGPSISFYQYKKKQQEKLNNVRSIKEFAQYQSQASTMDRQLASDPQNFKWQSQMPVEDQTSKNNCISEVIHQKTSRSQLIAKVQTSRQKDKIRQLQLQLQSKIKQIFEKNKQIFQKNKQIIQKNKQIQCLTNEMRQFKQNKNRNINNISQNIRIKQSNQKYNRQINQLKAEKQQLYLKLSAQQMQYLEKDNILIKINHQLLQSQHKIHELITNLSSANCRNKQLINQIHNKQKQMQQNVQKVSKLQECQYIINHLSNKNKCYQNLLGQQKSKNHQKSSLINELNKKLNQSQNKIENKQIQGNIKNTVIMSQMKRQLQQSINLNNLLKILMNQKNSIIDNLNTSITQKNNLINTLNTKIIENNNDGIVDLNAKIAEFVVLIGNLKQEKCQLDVIIFDNEKLLKQMHDQVKQKDEQILDKRHKIKQLAGKMQYLDDKIKSLLSRQTQQQVSQFVIQPQISDAIDDRNGQLQNDNCKEGQLQATIPQQTDKNVQDSPKNTQDKQIQVQMPQQSTSFPKTSKEQGPMIPRALHDQLQRRFQQMNRQLKKVGNRLNQVSLQLLHTAKLNKDLNEQLIVINFINTNQKYRQLQIQQEQ